MTAFQITLYSCASTCGSERERDPHHAQLGRFLECVEGAWFLVPHWHDCETLITSHGVATRRLVSRPPLPMLALVRRWSILRGSLSSPLYALFFFCGWYSLSIARPWMWRIFTHLLVRWRNTFIPGTTSVLTFSKVSLTSVWVVTQWPLHGQN